MPAIIKGLFIISLTVAGLILTLLLTQNYYSELNPSENIACFRTDNGACSDIGQKPFSALWTIPVSVFGFFYYLLNLLFFIKSLISSNKRTYNTILMLLSACSVITSVFFGSVMIHYKFFCELCFTTYILNLLLFIYYIYLCKFSSDKIPDMLKNLYKNMVDSKETFADVSFLIFLSSAISITLNYAIKYKQEYTYIYINRNIIEEVETYYQQDILPLNLPESLIKIGNPDAPIHIILFTDYFCSSCYTYHLIEKKILSSFKDKIYYEVYIIASLEDERSFLAAKAGYAAAQLGYGESFTNHHYTNYKQFLNNYDLNTALAFYKTDEEKKNAEKIILSDIASQQVTMYTEAASSNNIEGTPTLFINRRKILGVPSEKLIKNIILNELKNK